MHKCVLVFVSLRVGVYVSVRSRWFINSGCIKSSFSQLSQANGEHRLILHFRHQPLCVSERGSDKCRVPERNHTMLRRPISQEQLTVSVMLGFSPCCFSKVACTDFYSILHLTDTIALLWKAKMVSDSPHASFGDMEMDTGASGELRIAGFSYSLNSVP